MALTYVYLVPPPSVTAVGASGKTYTANAAGVVTGVAASDALLMTGVGPDPEPLLATGTTADRPSAFANPAIAGGINNSNPQPTMGLPFWDTTLSKTVYFVGTMRSATGWVDFAGNPA
jgi:hypothetical protein